MAAHAYPAVFPASGFDREKDGEREVFERLALALDGNFHLFWSVVISEPRRQRATYGLECDIAVLAEGGCLGVIEVKGGIVTVGAEHDRDGWTSRPRNGGEPDPFKRNPFDQATAAYKRLISDWRERCNEAGLRLKGLPERRMVVLPHTPKPTDPRLHLPDLYFADDLDRLPQAVAAMVLGDVKPRERITADHIAVFASHYGHQHTRPAALIEPAGDTPPVHDPVKAAPGKRSRLALYGTLGAIMLAVLAGGAVVLAKRGSGVDAPVAPASAPVPPTAESKPPTVKAKSEPATTPVRPKPAKPESKQPIPTAVPDENPNPDVKCGHIDAPVTDAQGNPAIATGYGCRDKEGRLRIIVEPKLAN